MHSKTTTALVAAAAATVLAAALILRRRRERALRLAFTDAHTLCRMLRDGEVQSITLLEVFIERVQSLDGSLNAVVVRDFERARAKARAADKLRASGKVLGVLHGLPMTVKEELAVAGLPTTAGDPARAAVVSEATCEAVARLESAGAIVFGKTNVPVGCLDWQAYNPIYGATSNPWDARRSPGGSSGGSAAAVAAGLTPLELGGDVAGSIRVPASFCGVVGLAPTHERVPSGRGPHSMVVLGPIARSAPDCALALGVLEAADRTEADGCPAACDSAESAAATTRDLLSPVLAAASTLDQWAGVKLALWSQQAGAPPIDADVARAFEHVTSTLRAAGAVVDVHARPDLSTEHLSSAGPGPGRGCALAYQALLQKSTLEAVLSAQAVIQEAWRRFFAEGPWDAIVMPVTVSAAFPSDMLPAPPANAFTPSDRMRTTESGEARPYGDHYFWPHLSIVAGLPAVAVPTGLTRGSRLPIGVQLVGPHGSDLSLLRLGHALMALCGTASAGGAMRPPTFVR